MSASSARSGVPPRASRARSGPRWDVLVAVAAGGAVGSVLRFWVSRALPHPATGFPWPTFVVNAVGCLVIGALMVLITESATAHRLLRPFAAAGVLGGFTTFSTYVTDTAGLLLAQRPGTAVVYLLATVVVALVAVAAGAAGARAASAAPGRIRPAERGGEE